jgi:hypothetical protein
MILAAKADAQALEEVKSGKANKVDTEISMRRVETVNLQLKQVVVLVTEMLRFEVHRRDIKVFEGAQHVEYSRAFLL